MEYLTLSMRESVAPAVVERLGALGAVEFTDLNGDLTSFKRHYTPLIRKCDDLEKKLAFFAEEMRQTCTPEPAPVSAAEYDEWHARQLSDLQHDHKGLSLLQLWESIVSERHRDYLELKAEREKTAAVLAAAGMRRLVIERAVEWFDVVGAGGGEGDGGGGNAVGSGLRATSAGVAALEAGRAPPAGAGAGAGGGEEDITFRHIAGVLKADDQTRFQRIVFRASAGHAAVRFAPIPAALMDERGEASRRAVFAVIYRGKALLPKLQRICAAFGASTHDIPPFSRPREVAAALEEAKRTIDTAVKWMAGSAAMVAHVLGNVRLALAFWRTGVARQKGVLKVLNSFTRAPEWGTVAAAGWVLKTRSAAVAEAVRAAHVAASAGGRLQPYRLDVFSVLTGGQASAKYGWSRDAMRAMRVAGSGPYIGLAAGAAEGGGGGGGGGGGHHHHAAEAALDFDGYVGVIAKDGKGGGGAADGRVLALPGAPPTHFALNKFTKVFQGIVNTYGVPRYGEANPAVFSVITFPFLFGVMYGDLGHASILTLFSAWMVYKEGALAGVRDEIFTMAFGGRYMLLLMGFFSIYAGLIYNDFFSLAMKPSGASRWTYAPGAKTATTSGASADVYPFGVDPEWHRSDNDLLFFNSLKMKMSVVLGITQMTFGLLLKVSNALHFKSATDLWYEAVPQVVFMVTLFGYMVYLIFLKWATDWFGPESPGSPPSLIDTLINIALKPGVISEKMYEGQAGVQVFVLLLAFATVPIMLAAKPYFLSKQYAAEKAAEGERKRLADAAGSGLARAGEGAAAAPQKVDAAHGGGGHDHHSFGELFIHQAIETIEFVLGSVSNTASYLRLWALSLAHSQLATVFWERAMVASMATKNSLFVFVGFGVFFGITTGVLLLMDVLECFLHALRLHWVEFQVSARVAFLRPPKPNHLRSQAIPPPPPPFPPPQNKFFKADGRKFLAFSYDNLSAAKDE